MTNIKICGWENAVNFIENYDENNRRIAVISIRGSKKEDAEIVFSEKKNVELLKIYFEDIIPKKVRGISRVKAMTIEDAYTIKDFVDRCTKDGITDILVHCYAGISRSGAVGMALARYLNGDDMKYWLSGKYVPNRHCFILMYKVLGLHFDECVFHHKSKISYKINRRKFRKKFRNIKIRLFVKTRK